MTFSIILSFCIGSFNIGNSFVEINNDDYLTQIRFYNEQGSIIKELSVPDFYGYKVAQGGKYLYFLNNEGINVYNGEGKRRKVLRDKGKIAVSSYDEYLVCASDNIVRVYKHFEYSFQIRLNSPTIRQIIFSSDNQYLGIMTRNEFTFVSLETKQILWTKEFSEPLILTKITNGQIVLVTEKHSQLVGNVYQISLTGEMIQTSSFRYQQYDEQVQGVDILPEGIKVKTHLREWILCTDELEKDHVSLRAQQSWAWQSQVITRSEIASGIAFGNRAMTERIYDTIPWPLGPTDSLHPIGNSWGEFQNYGGSSYYHPGVDILSPEVPGVPVYAVKRGYIKAWLSTGDELYWRFGIADSSLSYSDSCNGYLYAHIDSARYHKEIGDTVEVGELIGYLVYWPVDSVHFHHTHFAKIRDRGATWTVADWAFVFNPLISIQPNQDTIPPRFENAVTNQKFAFARNNTSTYLPPSNLNGDVDIIAKIHDKFSISTGDTVWDRLIPLKIEYEIIGQTVSQPRKLSFIFDKVIPPNSTVSVVYKSDNTCRTRGNYDNRDYYFILTNTDGDSLIETTDGSISWQTNNFPNGNYWVKVYAYDVSNNVSVCSMQVTVSNNPSIEEEVITNYKYISSSKGMIFNALGQIVNSRQLKPGVYFYQKNGHMHKFLIVKPTVYFRNL